MLKKYSSPCVKFTVNVKKDGKQFPIVFDGWNSEQKRRWIVISDPDIQAQMEKLEGFNVFYTLDESWEEETNVIIPDKYIESNVVPAIEKLKVPGGIALKVIYKKDFVEAKRWLTTLGIPLTYMRNKERLIELAKEQGYELILKKQ
jgi:hypothetical protein